MRPAAELLLIERDALLPLLDGATEEELGRPTVCDGWSVRDVLAHCAAALTALATGDIHGFTPDDNERDVAERRAWPVTSVLEELRRGYATAATVIDAAGGLADGIGLGEWVHGGDVREPLGHTDAYATAGAQIALDLIVERSRQRDAHPVVATVGARELDLGRPGDDRRPATLTTDTATFVRLVAVRRPDPVRYRLAGATPGELRLFT